MAAKGKTWNDDHVALAEFMLGRRFPKSMVKAALREAIKKSCGREVCFRTLEDVISAARSNLLAESGQSREEHRNDAYAFYLSVIRDKGAKLDTKINAQARLDKLMGLEAPAKMEVSGPGGKPIQTVDLSQLTDEQLEAYERARAILDGATPEPK